LRRIILGLALLFCGCTSAAQAPDQPRSFNPLGPYRQDATGFIFPVAVEPFRRSVVTEFNAQKTDVSAGYDKPPGPNAMAATIYVYPAPSLTSIGSPQNVIDEARDHLCNEAWEGIKSEIQHAHPDAKLIEQGQLPSPSPTFTNPGHRAVFAFTDIFAGTQQPLHSEADLFCYVKDQWLVAYRTTTPAANDYRADLTTLMRKLRWP